MRMRKKKHFDTRFEKCKSALIDVSENMLDVDAVTGGKPLMVEIGCGKGKFIYETALANPDIFFIALEREENVLLMAMEKALSVKLPDNLRFIDGDASKLAEIFPEESLSRIYVNFCDPWPPRKQAKRRLTSSGFLEIYYKLLKTGGEIHFKTDNMKLFEFSLNEFAAFNGLRMKNISLDLHSSDMPNITTEYEEKFSAMGMPIYRLEASKA